MDIQKIRSDTKGCHDKLFLNSAGSSLPPHSVVEKLEAYLRREESLGGYKLAEIQSAEIAGFYQEIALMLNTHARNIAFASNATDAYAKALSCVPLKEGDVILTTDDDYVSNFLHFISLKQRLGIEVIRARNLENGDLDLQNFRQLLEKHSPKLVSLTHIPTGSGLIQSAERVGELCQEFDCLYLVDACQSVGQIPVNIAKLKCDFLSATGRKFLRGPRGTGFLYVSDYVLYSDMAPMYVDLRGAHWTAAEKFELEDSARRFELWEIPYALLLGLKEAVSYANSLGLENIQRYNQTLNNELRHLLMEIPDVEVFDRGSEMGSIITFLKRGKSVVEHERMLTEKNVFYSVSSRESSLIDYEKKGINKVIRLSPHYFNTLEEIRKVAEIVRQI
jgi:cysteine desulfurase / selenocysteine lyase